MTAERWLKTTADASAIADDAWKATSTTVGTEKTRLGTTPPGADTKKRCNR